MGLSCDLRKLSGRNSGIHARYGIVGFGRGIGFIGRTACAKQQGGCGDKRGTGDNHLHVTGNSLVWTPWGAAGI